MSEILPFTLQQLFRTLRARRHVAAGIVFGCFLLGIFYLHITPVTYTVEMQVVAAAGEGLGGQPAIGAGAALLSQLGNGHSNAAGDNFELYLADIPSIETARLLAKEPVLMHRIFASEWSEKQQAWRRPFSLSGSISRLIKGIFGIYVPPWNPPDATRVEEFLQENVAISRSLVSPVVTISVQTTDRQFGVDLLNAVHQAVDGTLRQRTLARATSYVEYLNDLIEKATIVEYRAAVAETIMQQEKVRMTAASSAPYAADIFARASPSRLPTRPNGGVVLVGSIFLGVFIALIEAILRDRSGAYRGLLASSSLRSAYSEEE